ncbi:GGDEF domain-containing protein [Thermoleophilia bacterium SCSIO 60948]|nr:GGDEF domain-containing protein [Thermoleophilia bacterium SCSIO 60948]
MHADRNDRMKQLVPFLVAATLPFLVMPLPGPAFELPLTAAAAGLTLVVAAASAIIFWRRLPGSWLLGPALGYLLAVAVLREAGGGNVSGLGPLAIVPVVGLAMYSSARALAVGVLGVALVYWAPLLLAGAGTRYPASGWRIGLLFVCISAVLGAAILQLRAQLRRQTERMSALALTDELIGLPNRRAWLTALERAAARADRSGERFCVALIDVDAFKTINDANGHAAGDALLVSLARRWQDVLRRGDVLARLGGDEFGVLMPGQLDDVASATERVRAGATESTCSIGVAEWRGGEAVSSLIARADRLLYEAKANGGDRVRLEAAVTALAG